MKSYTYPTPDIKHSAEAILEHVGTDPLYFTLIADLTTLSHRCRFAMGPGRALAARYLDLPFAAVAFYGEGEGLRKALGALLGKDEPCYALIGEKQQSQLDAVVHVLHVDPEWQMMYRGDAATLRPGDAVPLSEGNFPAMRALARRGEMMAFELNALEKGPYFGVWRDEKLVSMAGTHLKLERMAEVGNIVTDLAYRRRGLATMAIAALIRALQAEGKRVMLQVFESNGGAIACYEKLGFERLWRMYLVQFELQ